MKMHKNLLNRETLQQDSAPGEMKIATSREEIDQQYKWRLEDIFVSDAAWEEAFLALEDLSAQLQSKKGVIGTNAASLLETLELETQLSLAMGELIAYARMRRDEDNAKSAYQIMSDKIMTRYYQIAGQIAFVMPEIASLPEETLLGFLSEEQGLAVYEHKLKNQIRQRAHILDETQEQLLSAFGLVHQGIEDTHKMLDNVDLDLGSILDQDGNSIKLTMAVFAQLRDHEDRHLRAQAFKQIHQSYADLGNTLAALYSTQIRADYLVSAARKFPSTLEAALFRDNLPLSLYENLLAAIHEAQPVLNEYFALRRELLQLKDLHIYDTYLPMIQMPKQRYSYEQACEIVKAALQPLGSEYGQLVEKHLTDRWIDVFETPDKTTGAFSWGTYRTHPYILLNYSGTLSDVFTLAHEIGHSLHTLYSARRPYPQAHYPIFLAEIASTVNENLLIEHLLKGCDEQTEQGALEKAWLLNHRLEGFRLTVFRQTMFAEFEQKAHALSQSGETLNAAVLNELYSDLLRAYFGPDTVIDDYMQWEWSRIPHFYSSFYVFKYATGFSAAVAISEKILNEGKAYVNKYLQFLGAGGSDYPLKILSAAGIDMDQPEPLTKAMQVFADTLKQLRDLTSKNWRD